MMKIDSTNKSVSRVVAISFSDRKRVKKANNVRRDTLNGSRFTQFTGQDRLDAVLAGIEAAGLVPIKINTVVILFK